MGWYVHTQDTHCSLRTVLYCILGEIPPHGTTSYRLLVGLRPWTPFCGSFASSLAPLGDRCKLVVGACGYCGRPEGRGSTGAIPGRPRPSPPCRRRTKHELGLILAPRELGLSSHESCRASGFYASTQSSHLPWYCTTTT